MIGAVGGRGGCNIVGNAVRRCSELDTDNPLEIERAVVTMDRHDEFKAAEAEHETCVCA